jgi:hypothetical protein
LHVFTFVITIILRKLKKFHVVVTTPNVIIMSNIKTIALSLTTVITLLTGVTFSAVAQQKIGPPEPAQTSSQRNWIRKLAKNPGAKYKGGIVTTVNGRDSIAYPRANAVPIR